MEFVDPIREAADLPGIRERFIHSMRVAATITAYLAVSVPLAEAQDTSPPRLGGVWSTTTTAVTHPGWDIEDLFACNCTKETYDYLRELIRDPANDNLSAVELRRVITEYNREAITALFTDAAWAYAAQYDLADDPAIQCEPFGAFRSIAHGDPILIEQHADRVVIRAEDMASDRTIYTDGRDHPPVEPTAVGHSVGRYEGSSLVVETVGVSANVADDNLDIHNSDQARIVERYTLSEDGSRLQMSFTLIDPVMFSEPLTLERPRIYTPEVTLQDAECESISGQP